MGRRMKIYGPKSLVPVNDEQTILSRQLELIDSCFKRYEIILVGGFQHEKLESKITSKVKFIVNKEYERTNVLHSIGLGLNKVTTDKVLIIYGDLVFNRECLFLPFNKESAIVVADSMKQEEVGCIANDDILENIFYKLASKWAQIGFFTGQELELLKEIAKNPVNNMWFGFEAINKIISRGGQFKVFSPDNARAVDIDSSYDLKLMESI
jgi:choline kinase